MLDPAPLADELTRRFGVSISGESIKDERGQRIRFRPRDLPATQGFSIDLVIEWRAIEAEFAPGSFAVPLLQLMEAAATDQRLLFAAFIQSALEDGAEVSFVVNGQSTDPKEYSVWPTGWRSVTLSMRKSPVVFENSAPAHSELVALTWSTRILGTVLALLPLEPIEPALSGEAEGTVHEVLVKRYERSLINRAACIELQGCRCKVCGFDFGDQYGPLGLGFIEVHHVEMVSNLKPGTIVNPATDLVPVCANCHSMLHRRKPPLSVAELKSIMDTAKNGLTTKA